ncbi:MAG: hypothetical protein LBF77_01815 [Spirochaetaceae bacterium]|jgi:hypothetical protein|nr:hypothetical protein [Spirochaetaceae bacterium]
MKRYAVLLVLTLFALSCASEQVADNEPPPVVETAAPVSPVQQPEPAPVPAPAPEPPPEEAEVFDPQTITQEVYDTTKAEIEEVIRQLNRICAQKDYDSWLEWLEDDYIKMVSDPKYLKELSETPRLRSTNQQLNNLKDYFLYVFAASRQNARVDEIEFLSPQRVEVIGVDVRTAPANPQQVTQMKNLGWIQDGKSMMRRVRFYGLEKVGGRWKIASTD